VFGYQVVNVYPHDPMAFTQGLVFRDGFLYESTGLNGRSTLRKVRLETGEVIEQVMLGAQFFGEGLTDWHDQLVQLTWKSNLGFVYDIGTLQATRTFPIKGDGWGLTHDSTSLILSDGTSRLRFIDPVTFEEIGSYTVRDGGSPVANLNELEYIRGEIYANVWQTDRVVVIAPTTGQVTGWVDFNGLLADADRPASVDAILNGIAYDELGDRLFVTGKLWPKLFEVKLVRR
jgi:glutamine cyclotransferase